MTFWELNDHITSEEFIEGVKKLKNAKAAGLTGVPPEAFKAMSTANLRHVYNHCNDFSWAQPIMSKGITVNASQS